MQLVFDNPEAPGPLGQAILSEVFKVAAKRFGIDQIPGTVRLCLEPGTDVDVFIHTSKEGMEIGVKTQEGKTLNKLLAGNTIKVILTPTIVPDALINKLAEQLTGHDSSFENVPLTHRLIFAWCHELVHVAQVRMQELAIVKVWTIKGRKEKLKWRGKIYEEKEIKSMSWEDLPWEKEANGEAKRIMPEVKNALKKFVKSPEGRRAEGLARANILAEQTGIHGEA